MQFLANENFPLPSVRYLRKSGYDIAAIIEDSPGIEDTEVLARAVHEQRVILTFDRDYGELIYRLKLSSPAGVIYFRYQPRSPQEPAEQLLIISTTEGLHFEGKFTVVERKQIRQRPLP
ncbi:MAG: DUF5615 family PIN-like protein [Rhizonema sp. PD37]|nr:DUF5615 family PIN-like protein [Rhizonema sp. PD37]